MHSVWFDYNNQRRYRPVGYYELLDLNESIKRTKEQLEETARLISEKQTLLNNLKDKLQKLEKQKIEQAPKVGDKYHLDSSYHHAFDHSILMVTSTNVEGELYYTLTIVECPNSPKHIGTYWNTPTTNIEDVLSPDENRLTKIN